MRYFPEVATTQLEMKTLLHVFRFALKRNVCGNVHTVVEYGTPVFFLTVDIVELQIRRGCKVSLIILFYLVQ